MQNLTAEKWMFKIEQLAVLNEWDKKKMIVYMQNRFTGLAKHWFNNLSSYDFCWEEWKNIVIFAFPNHHDFATNLRKMLSRHKLPTESMTEYYFRKMELLDSCNITDKILFNRWHSKFNNTNWCAKAAGRNNDPKSFYSEFLSTMPEEKVFSQHNKSKFENNNRFLRQKEFQTRHRFDSRKQYGGEYSKNTIKTGYIML